MHPNDTIPDPNPSGLCMCGCGQETSIVDRNELAKGLVRGHHRKFLRGHWHNGTKKPEAWATFVCPVCGVTFERLACAVRTDRPCCSFSCSAKQREPRRHPRRAVVDNGDGTATVPLTQGFTATIDIEDAGRVGEHLWHVHKCGYNTYAKSRHPESVSLQAFIMAPPEGMTVDHVDGDGLNCRRSNLRVVTWGQNVAHQPRRAPGRSGYRGVTVVTQSGRDRYVATIHHKRQATYLGTFDVVEDAARAYDAKARDIWGVCAVLNFPGATKHHDSSDAP